MVHLKLPRIILILPVTGPALMAVWSTALPLTASCVSPLTGFKSHSGLVGKLLVTWG